jgi:hypothetical protein
VMAVTMTMVHFCRRLKLKLKLMATATNDRIII